MATPKTTTWSIDPHTLAKHEILRRYLGAWFPILSSGYSRVVYIDGFCGPGRYVGGEPGSPVIALEEAVKHGDRLKNKKITFLFMDQDSSRIAHLEEELKKLDLPDNFTPIVQNKPFEAQFRSLLDALDNQGLQLAPTFAFVDPFGIKGVPYELVCRLLSKRSTEVLINFPVDPVNRWLEHPDDKIRQMIVEMYGTTNVLEVSKELNRTTALRMLYQQQLAKCAKFVRYFEMRNSRDRIIYCLFFASNHPLGHKKMKEAFWAVDPSGGYRFSDATNPNQLLMFENDPSANVVALLRSTFAGSTTTVGSIIKYVDDSTPFLEKHVRKALQVLESDHQIAVASEKPNGEKRRKNSYPDVLAIQFK